MASYYHVIGVPKTQTGSMDTYWDAKLGLSGEYRYAYLGCTSPSTPSNDFTFDSGSRGNSALRDFQMYTPFPTSIERGKLYLVENSAYTTDASIINKSGFVEMNLPTPAESFRVVTPTLNNSSLQTGYHVAFYDFSDINDLWDNVWRVQRGSATGGSAPLMSESTWTSIKNDGDWLGLSGLDNTTDDGKARIVAATLAFTETANKIEVTTLALPASNIVKGAILLGGESGDYDNANLKGVVPIVSA